MVEKENQEKNYFKIPDSMFSWMEIQIAENVQRKIFVGIEGNVHIPNANPYSKDTFFSTWY